jgi:predicted nucleic acid-binding Zn ribbon protein
MLLTRAWSQVAGSAIASRTRRVRLQRGLLEIEIEDGPWATTLAELLPRLSARLAGERPDLQVRKYRLVRAGASSVEPVGEVTPERVEEASVDDSRRAPVPASRPSGRLLEDRLPEVARRYLSRLKE